MSRIRVEGIVGQGEDERNEITSVNSEVLRNSVSFESYEKRVMKREDWKEIKYDFREYKERMRREGAII